ncbi:MAG: dTDP-4-dehydrorhamnose 3,5-epimerase [bacterium]
MIFTETALRGAAIVEPEPLGDERGFFARTWSQAQFEGRGLNARVVECSISFSRRRGTLRGLHYQAEPFAETKLVRCTMGAVYDVIVDLRRESPTFARWVGVELSAENRRLLYVPEGFAHGFLTLTDDCEVCYQISQHHVPEAARGVRWDDPAFGIVWPSAPTLISERDRRFPDFAAAARR